MLSGIQTLYAHVDMDAFFVSVELARRPDLCGKPVVVGGGKGKRLGVVAAASYEARVYGIRSGTSILEARRRCPWLIIIYPDHQSYESASRHVMKILRDVTPDVQVLSVDEAVVGLSGILKLWGPPMKIAGMIHRRIEQEVCVPCSIGVARFPLVAKLASKLAKRNGICMILPEQETAFLYDHRISLMPGVGRKTTAYLKYHNVATVGDLVKHAPLFWEKLMLTRAIENPYPKSISSECTLDQDIEDRSEVETTLCKLCRKVVTKMRNHKLKAAGISVRVRYNDFQTFERHRTRQELKYDQRVIQLARELFREADCLDFPVRLVGIRLFNLTVDNGDLPLPSRREDHVTESVCRVMDQVRRKYGTHSLAQGK